MKLLQTSGVPIYKQIAAQFRDDIMEDRIEEGQYLPSIRSLANDLKVSVITTMKAYEELEQEGLVTAVQGKGFVVNSRTSEMVMEQYRRDIEDSVTKAVKTSKLAGLSKSELTDTVDLLWSENE
ncbi:MAG: GntR family transcriptional regulator [Catonella sp.]|nr:GntR family transcriptional regulator [Catonella sp.]MDY6356845.1 GntR family transcriptional regulator [Catonella sp.]